LVGGATTALSQASTDAVCILAIRELADGYQATGNYDAGIGTLKDLAKSFAEREFAPAIVMLQEELQKAKERDRVAHTRAVEEARRMHIEKLQQRLIEAKAKKDAEAVQRLERLLGVNKESSPE
jgi:hypothetical protein